MPFSFLQGDNCVGQKWRIRCCTYNTRDHRSGMSVFYKRLPLPPQFIKNRKISVQSTGVNMTEQAALQMWSPVPGPRSSHNPGAVSTENWRIYQLRSVKKRTFPLIINGNSAKYRFSGDISITVGQNLHVSIHTCTSFSVMKNYLLHRRTHILATE